MTLPNAQARLKLGPAGYYHSAKWPKVFFSPHVPVLDVMVLVPFQAGSKGVHTWKPSKDYGPKDA